MLESIKRAFTQHVLDQALKLYDLPSQSCHILGGFENISYTCQINDQFYIMRFVHSKHRTYKEVLAEIEFIDYLAQHQIPVSAIKRSKRSALAEMCVSHDGYFTVTLSIKIQGHFLEVPMSDLKKIETLGILVGKMHHHAMSFKPRYKRKRFDQTVDLKALKPFLEKEDLFILDLYKKTLKSIHAIKKTPYTYGFIHNDLHQSNMFDHDMALIPIDFDDSVYHYFVSDIAMIMLYHYMFLSIPDDLETKLSTFLNAFLKGYLKQHSLPLDQLSHLYIMIQFRQIQLYFALISSGERHKYEAFFKLHTPYIKGDKKLFDIQKIIKQ